MKSRNMTLFSPLAGGTHRKPSLNKKGWITLAAISLLFILFVGETCLQQLMVLHSWTLGSSSSLLCTCKSPYSNISLSVPTGKPFASSVGERKLRTKPTVFQAYAEEGTLMYVANLTSRVPKGIQTVIEENKNEPAFGITGVRNVCMRPDGAIITIGLSEEMIEQSLAASPDLRQDWISSYNCSPQWGCVGFEMKDEAPEDVTWVPGNTTHILPYLANVFHHFADRVWPHIARHQYPLNQTTPHPNHILVHRFSTWLFEQAPTSMDRNTFMYQIRLLGLLSPNTDFVVVDGYQKDIICYERLILACATCDRLSGRLGSNITRPALRRYREAAFAHFGITEPSIPLPPRPLRITFYGRGDTHRRRVINAQEIVDHLRSWKSPPLEVTFVDELLAKGSYNQSLPEVVSLMSQTDIFITVHGANTWAGLFLPEHAGVIEIYGPCGPSSWLGQIVDAFGLKHETKINPWGEKIPSLIAGNTTECVNSLKTPDFTISIAKLTQAMNVLAQPIYGPRDTITRHWIHDWLS